MTKAKDISLDPEIESFRVTRKLFVATIAGTLAFCGIVLFLFLL